MYIDTHAHIQFNAYKKDGDAVIQRAFDAGVAIIAPSSQIDTSRRAVEYAQRWNDLPRRSKTEAGRPIGTNLAGQYPEAGPWLRAAIGLHPIHLEDTRVDSSEVGDQFKFRT
ncbi:MAG: TatD family hydrolase, partial [Candidatus Spechtbacterales bacterium]